jgi:two-component system OmpR family response regulator
VATEFRSEPAATDNALIEAGNISLNPGNYRVTVAGRPVELTYHEFDLLSLLAANRDRVVDFREITQSLWQSQGHKDVRRLNVLAFRLRGKLAGCEPYRIETVRGRGHGLVRAFEGIGGRNGES